MKPGEEKSTEKADTTLVKGLQILETLAASAESKGITELSEELSLNKSNVHRLLKTLGRMNYVAQEPDRSYRASLKLWRVGMAVMNHSRLASLCLSAMIRLRQASGESVHLSLLDGIRVLYIDKIDSDQSVRAYTERGGTAPLHCVATGKILLAHNYATLRDPVSHALASHTPRTITDIAALDAEVKNVRKLGYAVNAGEYRIDVAGIAAPIVSGDGSVVAAIGISGPIQRLSRSRMKELIPEVVEAARAASDLVRASET